MALLVVTTACEPAPSPAPTPTFTPEPTPTTTTFKLGITVWYAGLVMAFDTATAVLDERGGPVAVTVHLTNPGQDDVTLDFPISLTVGDAAFETTRETVLPSVAAGKTAFTTLHFNVIGETLVEDAVLRIGAPGKHQGIVPLTPGTVAAVALEPLEFVPHGTAAAGDLRLSVSHGQLRWDLPDWAAELPAASAALTLTYDVTYTGTFSGGTPFTAANVGLQLPNGQVLAPRDDGRIQSSVAIGPGQTVRRLATRFEIPANLPGI
ncbi:MAG TPA: hypothetical protein VJ506_12430, partial [Candidatus Limnocylindrales bacterium]|nr:hypothetical protein [Candidatus Limnocylindrales bacterium]